MCSDDLEIKASNTVEQRLRCLKPGSMLRLVREYSFNGLRGFRWHSLFLILCGDCPALSGVAPCIKCRGLSYRSAVLAPSQTGDPPRRSWTTQPYLKDWVGRNLRSYCLRIVLILTRIV